MAKARMLHKKISTSEDVNKLLIPARLLFTWIISHADDEGRLKGNPSFIKVSVVPYTKWSLETIKSYLEMMHQVNLIYYWEQNNEWFIEFRKWNEYQSIRKDRFEPSKLPSYKESGSNQTATKPQPMVNQEVPQYNQSELNKTEVNISEYKEEVADKNSFNKDFRVENPKDFSPSNSEETAALEIWKNLEPNNPLAFSTTYLKAAQNGLPADLFYVFQSEIKQDPSIQNLGAVFNKKVKDYLDSKKVNESIL